MEIDIYVILLYYDLYWLYKIQVIGDGISEISFARRAEYYFIGW
jgi:hypothetical protein